MAFAESAGIFKEWVDFNKIHFRGKLVFVYNKQKYKIIDFLQNVFIMDKTSYPKVGTINTFSSIIDVHVFLFQIFTPNLYNFGCDVRVQAYELQSS